MITLTQAYAGIRGEQNISVEKMQSASNVGWGDAGTPTSITLTQAYAGIRGEQNISAEKMESAGSPRIGQGMPEKYAENYRTLRIKGITIRKTTDVIIATFCIERRMPLLFLDRDFNPFVDHLGLFSALPESLRLAKRIALP